MQLFRVCCVMYVCGIASDKFGVAFSSHWEAGVVSGLSFFLFSTICPGFQLELGNGFRQLLRHT